MTCATPCCKRDRQRDSAWCADCLRDRWMLREPEWIVRAKAKRLPAKVLT